ncbi:glycosyltransferase family 4 protein [Clostridium omnivorum]|uniref:Glycosyltransferase n=1 Tax=Clostridium omnivorum TaxID=1604902 RepID=A0ABQ5N3E0_9CLOT|nr:glycosyltransferase family 4 protein [Clostridium sp. E14]GLC29727.1 hypothetical protein bsdE14_11370 [Clostridium sp. E14]
MDKLNKIYLVGTTYPLEGSINGPSAVVSSLAKEFSKQNVVFEFLNYESGVQSKKKYIFTLAKKILFSRNVVFNVHTDGYIIPFIVMLLSKINRLNKYYLTVHGVHKMEIEYFKNPNKKNLILEKILYRYFDNLICVSNFLQKAINEIYNRKENVYVIHNGTYKVDEKYIEKKINNDQLKLIMTGGIKPIKGIFELIEVVDHIRNKLNINVSLDVYGGYHDINNLNKLNELIEKYNLQGYVNYKGIIKDKNELLNKYREADLNMCLSKFDTFNVAVIEAMSVGTPTIATNMCGASELISDYNNSFIVNYNSELNSQIAKIIRFLLDNNELYTKISEKAYLDIRNCSWQRTADKYIEIFNSIRL